MVERPEVLNGKTIADILKRAGPSVVSIDIDVAWASPNDLADYVVEVIDACDEAEVSLKGVRYDPFLGQVLATTHGWHYKHVVLAADSSLNDQIEVVRSR